jgi:hypothetical protein
MGDPYLGYAGFGSGYGGVVLAPGARIAAFVHKTGSAAFANLDPIIEARGLYTTLNAALGQARASAGDVVFVLPGHTENISVADQMSALLAGTRIVGGGHGTLRPTFTWSAAASTFLLDVANVTIENCILEMAGDPALTDALTVTAPITISAAGCALKSCRVRVSVDADQLCTIAVTTTAGADDLTIEDCLFFGSTLGEVTTILDLIGCDRLVMRRNMFKGATSSVTVGVVRFATTASTDIILEDNTYINKKAVSEAAVTGLANVSGVSRNEHFAYLVTSTLTGWFTSTGIMTFHRPTVTDTAGQTGTEVVGTVSS